MFLPTKINNTVHRGEIMLSQAIRNNLSETEKVKENHNTIFNSLFKSVPKDSLDEFEFVKVLKKEGVVELPKVQTAQDKVYNNARKLEQEKNIQVSSDVTDNPYDFVENPDEVIVEFPIVSVVETDEKLPFFKSITYKLANLYC